MADTVITAPALKACPCCEGPAAFGLVRYSSATVRQNGWDRDTFHTVACCVCGLEASGNDAGFATQEEAAEAWNRRPEASAAKQPSTGLRRAALGAWTRLRKVAEWLFIGLVLVMSFSIWRTLPAGEQIGLAIIVGATLIASAICTTPSISIRPDGRKAPFGPSGRGDQGGN